MKRTLFTIILLALLVLPAYAGQPTILNIRTGLHEDYHRLVVELSETVKYKVKRKGATVTITMFKVNPSWPSEQFPSTGSIKVKGLKGDMDGAIKVARLDVEVTEGAAVKQTNWDEPFRIVIDVRAGKDRKQPAAKKNAKAAPKAQKPAAVAAQPPELLKAAEKTVTFNSGWRWIYRKKVMELLCRDVAGDEGLVNGVFKNELGLKSDDKDGLLEEADSRIDALKPSLDPASLTVFQAIYKFFDEGEDAPELETTLRLNPDTGFSKLGLFLLGDYYEAKGFLPEAHGYYSKILRDDTEGYIRSAALFQRGRLLFYENKYGDAKKFFEKAYSVGFPGADLWLADTLMIKGEFEQAWDIFGRVKNTEDLDPVSLMSLGDIYMRKGNFGGARAIFEKLRVIYLQDALATTFFAIRAGDAYLAEGRKSEAETTYTKIKDMLRDEEWAIASLSLADSLRLGGDNESLVKAEKLYRKVADGKYLGSEVTHLFLIDSLTLLGRFREAMDEVESFPKDFSTSAYRADMQQLAGKLVYAWIDTLYSKGDYAAVAEAGSRYSNQIPFGKKAESSLKVGKSFVALGLYTDAIESLDGATRMGSNSVAEEAMMELGRVYLHQKDTASTDRLYKAFLARFPKSRYASEVNRILLKTAYLEKEYGEVAASMDESDPESMFLKARSLAKLDRHASALSLFEKAAASFEAKGDKSKAAAAFIAAADSSFAIGNFKKAIERYGSAAGMLKDGDEDKSWAIYRMAQCYSRLDEKKAESDAVRDLKKQGDEYGQWAAPIFKTTPKSF
ncbi:MAG: tetratricopeptide repeat protein [Deltaproteobacteria bacterium]|nr:tetratricopeptide repeat protein [Deltaproteobacteria bacterium]